MTFEIALALAIVVGALFCFVTGVLRLDIVALLVLVSIALTGLVTPLQAISGFSNPSVVTIAGMFVISAALARTGVAALLGRRIHRVASGSPRRLVAAIMLTSGLLSAFINAVGLTAMMLPVVMDLARRSRMPPSQLLLPLVIGALMGSTTSMVGTPRNIVASNALRDRGYEAFQIFDFTPVGIVVLLTSILFVSLIGWKLLPERDPHRGGDGRNDNLVSSFDLNERLFIVRIPPGSLLDGRPLAASRLGSAIGLHVVAILRPSGNIPAPGPGTILLSDDRLLVEGRPELLREIQGNRHLRPQENVEVAVRLTSADIGLAEVKVAQGATIGGRTLADVDLRSKLGIMVLGVMRDSAPRLTLLHEATVNPGDHMLIQGPHTALEQVAASPEFDEFKQVTAGEALMRYRMSERLVTLQVTAGSMLIGRTLGESRLADAAGITVIAVLRNGEARLMPAANETFGENDLLVVTANPDDLRVLRALQRLEIEDGAIPDLSQLESERVGLLEVVLAPRTSLVGKTPRQLQFREKYGLSMLAIWRAGRSIRSNLRDVPLQFGDSLLLFGPRARLRVLASEPDFIGLTQSMQAEPRTSLAPLAVLSLLTALVPAMMGWTDISVSVLMGATLAVVTRCLTMDEAYRGIELSAIVLVAAMLPLGMALEKTGAADLLATSMLSTVGDLGPRGILAAICIVTALASSAIPAPALVVLMAPIAITVAETSGISPHAVMMGVALSASGLASPVGHPANALIMGPGGYRYGDYMKLGVPLTVLVLLIVLFIMPFRWPLT